MDSWKSLEEAAEHLGISTSSLYALAQAGRVPASKIGKIWRFSVGDLDGWVRVNKPIQEFFLSTEANIDGNDLLRDPQREGHAAALEFFGKGGKKAILQLPVGTGKSGLIAILPFGLSKGRTLVIAPNLTIRRELEENLDIANRRKCFWRKARVLAPEVMTAGPYLAVLDGPDANVHDCDRSHIVVTNIQQLASSADRWLPQFESGYFDLIIVDEGHHSAATSWTKVFERFPEAKVVNLTATPFRSDQREVPGTLAYRYSFRRAMIKGYIKKLKSTYVAPEEIHFTFDGDKRRHTLEEVLQLREEAWFSRGVALAPECNKHIVDASLDKLERARATGTKHQLIAVAMSVSHAQAVRALYVERGYEAAEIHSMQPADERADVIQRLRAGLLDCIVQVQMLGEGFDHPHLSVAAIFRPFRSLSPYVQFIGRIMRVIVQNDPRHPDNYGSVIGHIGLNLDQQWEDFKEMEREDSEYFQALVAGAGEEPLPDEVLRGDARMKLRPDMVVNREVVSRFLEEEFLSGDDEQLLDELRAQAEALGFDADDIISKVRSRKSGPRVVEATQPFPVLPQRQRQEARKRLSEEVNTTAKVLLNRTGLGMDGRDLSIKLFPGSVTGTNFVAAVQMVNHEVNRLLGVSSGHRGQMKTEEFIRACDALSEILNTLARRIIARGKEA